MDVEERDIREAFALYVEEAKQRLPWCARRDEETVRLQGELARLSRNGLLTINSQLRVNGAPSTDPVYGWGGPEGFVWLPCTPSSRAGSGRAPPQREVFGRKQARRARNVMREQGDGGHVGHLPGPRGRPAHRRRPRQARPATQAPVFLSDF